ncbi:MAG: hypothetical protein ACFCUI_08130, partial [Bernardetiaceae bacterium]
KRSILRKRGAWLKHQKKRISDEAVSILSLTPEQLTHIGDASTFQIKRDDGEVIANAHKKDTTWISDQDLTGVKPGFYGIYLPSEKAPYRQRLPLGYKNYIKVTQISAELACDNKYRQDFDSPRVEAKMTDCDCYDKDPYNSLLMSLYVLSRNFDPKGYLKLALIAVKEGEDVTKKDAKIKTIYVFKSHHISDLLRQGKKVFLFKKDLGKSITPNKKYHYYLRLTVDQSIKKDTALRGCDKNGVYWWELARADALHCKEK